MKFLFALAAALLSLGLTQPTLSGPLDTVLILQCTVAGTAFEPTAASEGRNVRVRSSQTVVLASWNAIYETALI